MSLDVLLFAQAITPSGESLVRDFGYPVATAMLLAGVVGFLGRVLLKDKDKQIEEKTQQIEAWEKRWEKEHDLRVSAERRAEVATEQAKTANAFFEALKSESQKAER